MSKLVKQFKREVQKNPQKVGLLGLLVVVAIWFWGPLVMPKSDPPRAKPKPVENAATATPSTTTAAAGASAVVWRWQDLDARLSTDPRMRSFDAGDVADERTKSKERNPFETPRDEADLEAAVDALIAEVLAEDEAERIAAEKVKMEVVDTPAYFDQRPLYLTSTFVGGTTRRAIINGRAYAEGVTMGVEAGREIVLKSVSDRRAVVEWNGRRRELKILRPGETGAE